MLHIDGADDDADGDEEDEDEGEDGDTYEDYEVIRPNHTQEVMIHNDFN